MKTLDDATQTLSTQALAHLQQRLSDWLGLPGWILLPIAIVLLAAVVDLVLYFVLGRLEQRLVRSPRRWDDPFLHALRLPLRWWIWISALMIGTGVIGAHLGVTALTGFLFKSGALITLLLLAWSGIRLIRRLEQRLVFPPVNCRARPVDQTSASALTKIVGAVLIVTLILIGLQILGVSMSSILAMGGFGGLVIGFAARDVMANFFGGTLNSMAGGVGQISVAATSAVYRATIPGLSDLGLPGRLLFSYGFMVYLAIVLAVVLQLFLNRTRPGLNLRSVGENPATADAAGINVSRNKYLATCVGAGISGLGGLYYTMDYIKGTWANDGTIESLGWLAVALVIFATWRTVNAIWGSYLFGLLFWVYLIIPGLGRRDTYLFNMLPYLVTIAVLIFVSLRNKKENQPPASLGLAYFREER